LPGIVHPEKRRSFCCRAEMSVTRSRLLTGFPVSLDALNRPLPLLTTMRANGMVDQK
jgi:hypothetical protein